MSKQENVTFQITVNTKKLNRQVNKVGGIRGQLARVLFELGAKAINKKITVEYDVKQIAPNPTRSVE